MLSFAISVSLLVSQPTQPELEEITPQLRSVICEAAPDFRNATNSQLYRGMQAMYGPRWRVAESDWARIPRDDRERYAAEGYERARLRAISDYPRLSEFIVTTVNRYGAGEDAMVVSTALRDRICRQAEHMQSKGSQ